MGKKHYEHGPGETNQETTDEAAEGGSDHNEAQAQRPAEGTGITEQLIKKRETTTTTPDSQAETANTNPQNVGELDQQSPDERLKMLRGWMREVRLGGPRQADWERFESLVGTDTSEGVTGEQRRP